jgi:hypothetical protein
MNIGIVQLVSNLGMGFEDLVLLVVNLGALIAYAKRADIGVACSFILNAVCTMIFIALASSYSYAHALDLTLMFLVILSLTLYSNMHGAAEGTV